MKYLLNSYTKLIWAVYMEHIGGEVGTRSRVYVIEFGRCGYTVGGGPLLLYIMTKLIYLGLWYHIICVVELHVHLYLYNVQYCTNMCGFTK